MTWQKEGGKEKENEGGVASQLNPKRAQVTVVGVETNQLNRGGADVLDRCC